MQTSPPVLADVARLFIRYPMRWLLPAALIALGTIAYAFLHSPTWQASQALIVRAEASGNLEGPGRFRHLAEMKTLEETLLEIAKSRAALAAAMVAVGPPADRKLAEPWPTPKEVDEFSDAVTLVPPKGAEFGATELFYLKVKDRTAERACALADAVATQMLQRFQGLRDERASSVARELAQAVDLARAQRNESVRTLGDFEARVGGDVAELRNLEQLGSGDGDVRKLTVELENELRQAEQNVRNLHQLIDLLGPAQADPAKILATPNRLLESQPSLRRLKEGLVDAQLRTSQLLGSMSQEHPLVLAALDAESEVRTRLHAELEAAVEGLQTELGPAEALLSDREKRLAAARLRLDRLAALRAEYSSLNAENTHRTRQLELAEKQLLDAQAAQAGAMASSLVARVDVPDAGSKPLGPGRLTLAALGCIGGFVVGVGCLLLSVPTSVANRRTPDAPPSWWMPGPPSSSVKKKSSAEFEAEPVSAV